MLRFEQTQDLATVQALLTDPKCYARMADDASPAIEEFRVWPSSKYTAYLAFNDDTPIGVLLLFPTHPGEAEAHFCFAPPAWGCSRETARLWLEWVWKNTAFERLTGTTPSFNRLALRLARSVGFEPYDIQVGAGTRRGEEYDNILTKIERPK